MKPQDGKIMLVIPDVDKCLPFLPTKQQYCTVRKKAALKPFPR